MHRPSNWTDYRSLLKGRRFDLVFDPQGLSKSSVLAWLSGARTRVGFDYSHGREIAPLLANKRVHRSAIHMADTYRQLLSPWTEVTEHAGEFKMPRFENAAEVAARSIKELNVGDDWIALNPGAGWTTRVWPVERFVKLAKDIRAVYGRKSVVFWAGENERLMASVIAEESEGSAIVAPKTNLQELLEMFRRCSMLVTGDTGPLHIASSIGTPRVALHGPTWAEETGPYQNNFISIQSPISNLGGKVQRSGDNTMMKAIEVQEVLDAVGKLIRLEGTCDGNSQEVPSLKLRHAS